MQIFLKIIWKNFNFRTILVVTWVKKFLSWDNSGFIYKKQWFEA